MLLCTTILPLSLALRARWIRQQKNRLQIVKTKRLMAKVKCNRHDKSTNTFSEHYVCALAFHTIRLHLLGALYSPYNKSYKTKSSFPSFTSIEHTSCTHCMPYRLNYASVVNSTLCRQNLQI
ncbi:unnamed protein product [Albugo candida]|uniref:Secreted protein n=1 Tax=Albugo candida TaxID=65357 RepID=A0A024GFX4_9STRA|nr:unnamed protein product [Albugo candida]|eukprot:CCI45781.1 unnamed protein product [Albugo candida]